MKIIWIFALIFSLANAITEFNAVCELNNPPDTFGFGLNTSPGLRPIGHFISDTCRDMCVSDLNCIGYAWWPWGNVMYCYFVPANWDAITLTNTDVITGYHNTGVIVDKLSQHFILQQAAVRNGLMVYPQADNDDVLCAKLCLATETCVAYQRPSCVLGSAFGNFDYEYNPTQEIKVLSDLTPALPTKRVAKCLVVFSPDASKFSELRNPCELAGFGFGRPKFVMDRVFMIPNYPTNPSLERLLYNKHPVVCGIEGIMMPLDVTNMTYSYSYDCENVFASSTECNYDWTEYNDACNAAVEESDVSNLNGDVTKTVPHCARLVSSEQIMIDEDYCYGVDGGFTMTGEKIIINDNAVMLPTFVEFDGVTSYKQIVTTSGDPVVCSKLGKPVPLRLGSNIDYFWGVNCTSPFHDSNECTYDLDWTDLETACGITGDFSNQVKTIVGTHKPEVIPSYASEFTCGTSCLDAEYRGGILVRGGDNNWHCIRQVLTDDDQVYSFNDPKDPLPAGVAKYVENFGGEFKLVFKDPENDIECTNCISGAGKPCSLETAVAMTEVIYLGTMEKFTLFERASSTCKLYYEGELSGQYSRFPDFSPFWYNNCGAVFTTTTTSATTTSTSTPPSNGIGISPDKTVFALASLLWIVFR